MPTLQEVLDILRLHNHVFRKTLSIADGTLLS
jgi:hypothetical protein